MISGLELQAFQACGKARLSLILVGGGFDPQPTVAGFNQLTVTVPTLFCESTVPEEFVTTPLTV